MKTPTLRYKWLQDEHGISLCPEKTTETYPKDVAVRLQQLRQGIIKNRIKLEDYHEAVLKWPDNPDAKLMLIGALFKLEQEVEARKWLTTALEEHPDSVYVVHACVQFCDTHADALKLGPIHGPNFSILDFPPSEGGAYTLAVFEAFETSLIDYYTLMHNFGAAKKRLNRLLAFGFSEQDLDEELAFLLDTSMDYYRERDAREIAQRISVFGIRKVALKGLGKPELQHPELECLYSMPPEEMSEGLLKELLELPRESLIEDLRAILRDGLERYDEIVVENLPELF